MRLRLGVNIDHVATIRNARGGAHPDPVRAARLAVEAGADGITAHLREDRRHITDSDIERLMREIDAPLNLEMAATAEMQAIALRHCPHAVCLVPERREERTTEGGLDVSDVARLRDFVMPLTKAGIRVSLFIAPRIEAVEAAHRIGAPVVELHTGRYCELSPLLAGEVDRRSRASEGFTSSLHELAPYPNPLPPGEGELKAELQAIENAVTHATQLGIECHAGHGLTAANVGPIAAIQDIAELNIGHYLIGEAIFIGLAESIRAMRMAMDYKSSELTLIHPIPNMIL